MTRACVFCGTEGRLTGEHVFGDWLSRIGLSSEPLRAAAGPLNRELRDLGVTQPFQRRVRDVCGECNNGWLSRLEAVAHRVLTPFILGEAGTIDSSDQGAIAAWGQKTALVSGLLSSVEARARGHGLPASEFQEFYERRAALEPLPATQVWIGRYEGGRWGGATWVTPLVLAIEGMQEPDYPHGYVFTVVVGELLLQGVRFTTPTLQVGLSSRRGIPQLWPPIGQVRWPGGAMLDDASYLDFAGGRELHVTEPPLELHPWKPATGGPECRQVGAMFEWDALCGQHVIYFPTRLASEAMYGRRYAFETSCECGSAYLIVAEADGAHLRLAGEPEAISELYEALSGEDYILQDAGGTFVCKHLTGPVNEVYSLHARGPKRRNDEEIQDAGS